MVLQLDAQSLRARVPASVFERALDLYRRQRVLDVTLTPASASEWHLDGEVDDFVSRSTAVLGSKSGHSLRTSFGETRAGTGFWHSKVALVSKWAHCAQV